MRLTLSVPGINTVAFNSAGTDGAYKAGDKVTVGVVFNEAVTVDTTGGTPQLEIDVDGTATTLDYVAGNGTTTLRFDGYTVAANDLDADGVSVEANKLEPQWRHDQGVRGRQSGCRPRPRRGARLHEPQGRRREADAVARGRRPE